MLIILEENIVDLFVWTWKDNANLSLNDRGKLQRVSIVFLKATNIDMHMHKYQYVYVCD